MRERGEQPLERHRVLLGQELGGRHQRRLEIVLHREQHGEQRHDRLAGTHVAHQQPVHPIGRGHVGGDLPQGTLLIVGQLPGQRLAEAGREIAADGERHAAPAPLRHGAGPNEHELQVQQLVECEPPAAQLRFERGRGPVDRAERVGQRGETERAPERLGQHVLRQLR